MAEARCCENNEAQIIDISEQIWYYPDRLRKSMEAAGLSQAALAKKAGVPESTIRKLLQGETRDPRASTFVPVCKAVGADANAVFGLSPAVNTTAELTRESAQLVEALRAQIENMREQDKESDRRLVNLRTMLFDAGKGQAAAEGRVAALEALLSQKSDLIREQTETIAQYECRMESKRHRIEELSSQASALRTTVEAKDSELAAVRKSRDKKAKICKRLIWSLCLTVVLLIAVCVYAIWEISNFEDGITGMELQAYIEKYLDAEE